MKCQGPAREHSRLAMPLEGGSTHRPWWQGLCSSCCPATFLRAGLALCCLPRRCLPTQQPWHQDASWPQRGSSVPRRQIPGTHPGTGLSAWLGKLKGRFLPRLKFPSDEQMRRPLLHEEQSRGKRQILSVPLGSEERMARPKPGLGEEAKARSELEASRS